MPSRHSQQRLRFIPRLLPQIIRHASNCTVDMMPSEDFDRVQRRHYWDLANASQVRISQEGVEPPPRDMMMRAALKGNKKHFPGIQRGSLRELF